MPPDTMLSPEFLRYLASLGVGGALAGMLFFFYRRDVRSYTELWKTMSDTLLEVVRDNTKAITENTEMVKSLHKRMDQWDSIERRRK